jgi:predicted nucleotidyltransferase
MMGSVAYGVSSDTSDVDVYGFCIPPKDVVFPHLAGEIFGFGKQKKRFDQYQQHHVKDQETSKMFDLSIYSIVRYFHLCMDNNPNMIDSLFTPRSCVLHTTSIGEMVRERRKDFLHKGSWHRFKGYAYSQLHKMAGHERTGKRKQLHEEFGFDVKFAYHVVRLLYEAEMILAEHDLELTRHREHLKAIRRGEVTEEEIRTWATEKERALERMYEESKLPYKPDEAKIRTLLLQCLEHHYETLTDAVIDETALDVQMRVMFEQVDQVRKLWNVSTS